MFTIYKAQTAHLAAEEVISAIKGEGRHVVIAPDPFTLAVEKTISAKLGKKSFFNVEVMSFARLASVFLGEKTANCLSPAGSVMLMEKVIRRERENLVHYQKAAGKPGFASEIYAAITAVRNSGVTPDSLREVEGKLKGYVKAKTHDIAHLYDAYLTELQVSHTDSTTRLEALTRYIEQSEEFGDVCFYVVDHVDLNQKQLEVLCALMTKAKSLSVAVADGAGAGNERIYPKLLKKLHAVAKRAGVRPREVAVTAPMLPVKKKLADELFAYSFSSASTDAIALWEAKDMTEEVTLLATEITRLVRKEGRRYSDVAVITPSFEEYLPILERVFRAYGIPFFADRRVPLTESDLFRHLTLALEVTLRGYDKTLVRKYVLHSLFEATPEEKAAFFDYLDKSGVDRGYFKEKFTLFEDDPIYPMAEKVRAALCAELKPLEPVLKEGTISAYAEAFHAFLSLNDFDQKVERYLAEVQDAGLPDQAEVLRQAPAAITELLDTLVELRGEDASDGKDFLLALTAGAGQVKIASLPVSLDCVYFAPVKQAMYAPIPVLFVLGAEEGLFPLETVGEGILGTAEYDAWQDNNIIIENTGIEELEQSRFHAVQLLLRGESTYLSHVESKNSSPCFLQIKEIFSLVVKKCADVLKEYDADVLIPTEQVARMFLADSSRRYHEGLLTERERVLANAVAKIFKESFPLPYSEDKPVRLSVPNLFFRKGDTNVSQLEAYFKCPFLHFARYGLGAREKDVATFDKKDDGIVVHDCMKRFCESVNSPAEVSDDQARAIAEGIAKELLFDPKYDPIRKQPDGARVIKRAIRRCREVAVMVKNQMAASAFCPKLFERHFPDKYPSKDGLPPLRTVEIDGVSLTGQIDRVDVLTENGALYAAAFDYKTGSAKIDTKDLYAGKKIQLPLYLAVLEKSGYAPVASLYYALSDRVSSGEQVLYGPKLAETGAEKKGELIRKLDEAISEEPSPYTGVSVKGDCLEEKQGMLLGKDAFQAQVDYAVAVASGAVREIKQGYIRPATVEAGKGTVCDYCSARNACRHAGEIVRPSAPRVSPDDILRVMQKEEDDAD